MITEEARYEVHADQTDEFIKGFAAALPLIRAARGCHGATLHRSVENPTQFVLLVSWESVADHLEGFREAPEFETWRSLTRPHLSAPVFMHHLDALDI